MQSVTVVFLSIKPINKRMRTDYKNFSKETADLNQTIVEDSKAMYEVKTRNEKILWINLIPRCGRNIFQLRKRQLA